MLPETVGCTSPPIMSDQKRRQARENIDKDDDYFLNKHKGFTYNYNQAHTDQHLPEAIFDFFCVIDTAQAGQLNEQQLDNAMDIIKTMEKDKGANCAELHYKHFPEAVKDVLLTWDADRSGSVGVSELVMAAEAQKKMKDENRLVKRLLGGAVVVILILMTATFFLSVAAAEMAKDMRPDSSGVQKATNGNVVASGVAIQKASISDFPTLELEQLFRARSVQFVSGGEAHSYDIGSVRKNPTTQTVTLGTNDGHTIVVSLDKTVTLDGVAVALVKRRRLNAAWGGALMTSGSFTMMASGGIG
jgi:hypothetical protein